MRRFLSLFFIAFFCVVLTRSIQMESEQKIVQAFQEIGARPERYVLHYGGRIRTLHAEGVHTFLSQFKKNFALPTVEKKAVQDGVIYFFSGKMNHFDVTMHLYCETEKNKEKNPYLSFQIIGYGSFDIKLLDMKKQLAHILRINNIEPRFDFSIQGSQKAYRGQENIIKKALPFLHAREVESLRTNTISVSAYSPVLTNSLTTDGREMNVQIATKLDKEKNRYIVTMGTPIITIEY